MQAPRPTRTGLVPALNSGRPPISKQTRPLANATQVVNKPARLPMKVVSSKNCAIPVAPKRTATHAPRAVKGGVAASKAFDIFVDENNRVPSEDNNIVKQLEKTEGLKEDRVPLGSLAAVPRRPAALTLADSAEAEAKKSRKASCSRDEEESEYASALEGGSEYGSASSAMPASPLPLQLPPFADDMLQYMMEREKHLRPDSRYLNKQEDLSADMRSLLVDWLHDVVLEYKLEEATFHLTISIVDRLLSVAKVGRLQVQLVGTAALLLAAKLEEIYPPQMSELVYVTDETYTASQIRKMERKLLAALHFDVTAPTAHWFASHLAAVAGTPSSTRHLLSYLLNLSTLDYAFLRFAPSVVASACVALSHAMSGDVAWPCCLESTTGLSPSHLQDALDLLISSLAAASSYPHRSIYESFCSEQRGSVARLPAPATIPSLY